MKRNLIFLLIVLPALLMALAGGAAAEPAATSSSFIPGEPNDTFATANDAWSGYLMTVADVDYIRVPLDQPTHVELEVEIWNMFYHSTAPVLRVQLALFDPAGNLLAEDADCGEQALVNADVPAGLYVARVRACPAAFDADQRYTLAHTGYSRPIEWEPNNTRATANVFDDSDAVIAPAGDVDFYRFEGAAGQTGYASLEDEGTMATEMALMNATGTVLATSGPDYLHFTLPADGIYYIRVRAAGGANWTGNYRLYGGVETSGSSPGDVEPNDTPAQAVPVAYGDPLYGEISDTDVVDYYRFTGQAGDNIVVAMPDLYDGGGYNSEFALYDPSMNPVLLLSDNWASWATLPTAGIYTLAFSNSGEDLDAYYSYRLVLTGGDEPNNTMATATDIGQATTLDVVHDYPCDTDWYRFDGRAGDVLATVNAEVVYEDVYLYAADGTYLRYVHVLPADGVYYLRADGLVYDDHESYCMDSYSRTFREALWVSAAVDGLGGSAAIKRGDIATRKTAAGQWQIVFDASDVGITQNVAAFERMPNGSILMSLAAAQNVPGLGAVSPQDIIRFSPTALGDTTAGTFQWFLDGSDVGLSTAGEKIDAISMQRDINNPLRISTTGSGSAPRQSGGALKFADEDVINFVGTAYGANSAGAWRVYLDGSTVPGMAAEDVSGMTRVELYPARDSQTLLSFDSAFTIGGTKGNTFDVLREAWWLPAVQRLTDKKIDGLSVGPAWTP